MALTSVTVSAIVSFSIAWLGWNKLEKRAERSAQRSETFSLLNPTVGLIGEFRDIAEEALMKQSISNGSPSSDISHTLLKKQLLDTKFLTKYNLLRTKLTQLESRNIAIASNLLIDLRISFTDGSIDSMPKYSKAIMATDRIETELYQAFERAYPKSR
ncbi:hypothetical protein M0358_002379 [Vibrio fluvialis]|nr:hypothetical protein [Vibrio fluvialis]